MLPTSKSPATYCGAMMAMMSGTLLPMLQARAALETLETSLPVYQDAWCCIQETVAIGAWGSSFVRKFKYGVFLNLEIKLF
jgi:hypothetical protein